MSILIILLTANLIFFAINAKLNKDIDRKTSYCNDLIERMKELQSIENKKENKNE